MEAASPPNFSLCPILSPFLASHGYILMFKCFSHCENIANKFSILLFGLALLETFFDHLMELKI